MSLPIAYPPIMPAVLMATQPAVTLYALDPDLHDLFPGDRPLPGRKDLFIRRGLDIHPNRILPDPKDGALETGTPDQFNRNYLFPNGRAHLLPPQSQLLHATLSGWDDSQRKKED